MERLTIRNDNLGLEEISFINPNDPEGMYDILDLAKRSECGNGVESGILLQISAKLAEYEDTGFTPDDTRDLAACMDVEGDGKSGWDTLRDLIELEHYRKLKQQGRLIELPCKVGDTVYVNKKSLLNWFCFLETKPYIRCEVIGVKKTRTQLLLNLRPLTERTSNSRYHRFFSFLSIGKTVFLTEEEAEQALKTK